MIRAGVALAAAVLALATPASSQTTTIDAVWTAAAERSFVTRQSKGFVGQLPEVRVYDGAGRLILRLLPAGQNVVAAVRAAMARPRAVNGPGLADALSALEIRGGGDISAWMPEARFTIIDYWATWCAPCKPVSAALERFISDAPEGVVLVRAETDFVAAQRRARAAD